MASPSPFSLLLRIATVVSACALSQWASADEAIPPNPSWRWFKGNLHTHSLWSDGNDFPEMIAEWYRSHDYNFLALSDHNVLSVGERWIDEDVPANRGAIGGIERYLQRFGDDWVQRREQNGKRLIRLKPLGEIRALVEQRGKFILIQAEEITDSAEGLPVHVNATNVRALINPQGGSTVREAMENNLNAVMRQSQQAKIPILAHLNHPNFSYAITAEDLAAVLQERYFEVFNGHPAVNHRGDGHHASVERLWDIANTLRVTQFNAPPLSGLATDDTHNYFGLRDASPGRGWVMVRAKHLTPESLLRAMQHGDFYASSGITLDSVHFDRQLGNISLKIASEEGVTYTTQFIGTLKDFDPQSEPVVDEEGKQVRTTQRYSAEVGVVLSTQFGANPSYRLTGKELYVRATVTSSKPPENPIWEGQKQQAWTQPVGWQKPSED